MMKTIINFLFFSFLLLNPALAQNAAILPQGKTQFLDNNGNPLSSGKVFFYIPSTTTFKTTWQDAAKTTPNTNPVILDAGGRAIIYGDGTYRQLVRTSANVTIFDAVTASAGTGGGTTGTGDGDLVGTVKPWAGLIAPNQYAFAYGQEISRTTYAAFFTAVTLNQNISCASGSPILTGLSDTSQIPNGAVIETTCIAAGSTVLSKTSTTVTMNNNASLTTATTAVFFLYGNGNGSTTFNVPDLRGVAVVGRTNMGGTAVSFLTSLAYGSNPASTGAIGGNQTATLTTINLPPYTPAGTVGNVTAAGTVSAPTITMSASANSVVNSGTGASANLTGGGGALNQAAITGSSSTPIFSGTPVAGGTFTGTAQGGTSTPFGVVQPSRTLNYIVKITPDQNSADASGVTSFGLMTGDIACGSGLVCTGNIVSTAGAALWAANGSDIYNTNSGRVGIGAIPSVTDSKFELLGSSYWTIDNPTMSAPFSTFANDGGLATGRVGSYIVSNQTSAGTQKGFAFGAEVFVAANAPTTPVNGAPGAIYGGTTNNQGEYADAFGILGTINNQKKSTLGWIGTLGAITAGSAYTNGSYPNVPLTGGTGSQAAANITVAGGVVTVVTLVQPGTGYTVGNTLSALAANIGGTGSGFSIPVATIVDPTPQGTGIWGIVRGNNTSNGGVDAIRASNEADDGGLNSQIARSGLFIFQSRSDNPFSHGVFITGAQDYGVRVGAGSNAASETVPTHPFAFLRKTDAQQRFSVNNVGGVLTPQAIIQDADISATAWTLSHDVSTQLYIASGGNVAGFNRSAGVPAFFLFGSSSGATSLRASAVASGVLTLPAETGTLVTGATLKTLTNTTFDTAGTGNSFSINGVAATANTGTGAVARAAGPVFTTPTLGVATATTINGVTLDNLAWTTYTPTVTSSVNTITTKSATGFYKQVGKSIFLRIEVSITTNGTGAGRVEATLPVAVSGGLGNQALAGFNGTTAAVLATTIAPAVSTTKALFFTATGTYPGADNTSLITQGVYEVP